MTPLLKTLVEYSPLLSLAGTMLLAVLALWVDARTDRKISAAVDPLKDDLEDLQRRTDANEASIAEARSDIEKMPTKADLARVEGEVKATLGEATAAAAGVKRLETIFIQRGVENV